LETVFIDTPARSATSCRRGPRMEIPFNGSRATVQRSPGSLRQAVAEPVDTKFLAL